MFNNLLNKPESYRRKFALATSVGVTLVIAVVWTFSNNFFGFGTSTSAFVAQSKNVPQQQVAAVVVSNEENSPLSNTKSAFSAAFGEIGKQFDALKESVSSVIVPFITGIDVYNKTEVK